MSEMSPASAACPAEARAFLGDIREQPDDDTPRLILADWLEERGFPWGTLLRAQTQRARLRETDPAWGPLAEQEEAWMEEHAEEVLAPFRELGWRPYFRRGLIHVITRISALFDSRLDELAATDLWQWVETVRLLAGPDEPLDLVLSECSQLAYFPGLDLVSAGLHDEGVARLCLSPHLGRLMSLELGFNQVGPDGADALAFARSLTGLRTLRLDDNYLGPEGARALAVSGSLQSLLTLDLRWNGLGPEGARALVASAAFPRLTTLYLGNNDLGDEGARALLDVGSFARLRTLYLEFNGVSPEMLSALRKRYGPDVHA